MGRGKSLVVTAYGHARSIDKIAVSSFDESGGGYYGADNGNAMTYCKAMNSLQLKDDAWVVARIVTETALFSLDEFLPLDFSAVLKLDNRAVQRVLREVETADLMKAMKGNNESVNEKIFANMSKRAAQMLKEDIDNMYSVSNEDIRAAQEKIIAMIQRLEDCGEIVVLD